MENSDSKKTFFKTITGWVVAITFCSIITILVNESFNNKTSFEKILMQTANKLNESCPMMIDKETRFENTIVLSGKVLQYNYTLVNVLKDSVDLNAFENIMKPMLLNNLKTNPNLKLFRDNKGTMSYSYKDRTGSFITNISISSDQYIE